MVFVAEEYAASLEGLDLAEICITSGATLTFGDTTGEAFSLDEVPGVSVVHCNAEGEKCERCGQVLPEVGRNSDHPDICNRCAEAVSNLLPPRNETYTLIRLGLLISALVILLDQASKFWIVHYVMALPRIIEITPFNVVMVWNKGVSFGLFSSQSIWTQAVLGGLAVAFSVVLAIWLAKAQNKLLGVSLGLVIGGALGNAIDRAIYHAVADFLDFHAAGYHWPSFNVADMQ